MVTQAIVSSQANNKPLTPGTMASKQHTPDAETVWISYEEHEKTVRNQDRMSACLMAVVGCYKNVLGDDGLAKRQLFAACRWCLVDESDNLTAEGIDLLDPILRPLFVSLEDLESEYQVAKELALAEDDSIGLGWMPPAWRPVRFSDDSEAVERRLVDVHDKVLGCFDEVSTLHQERFGSSMTVEDAGMWLHGAVSKHVRRAKELASELPVEEDICHGQSRFDGQGSFHVDPEQP